MKWNGISGIKCTNRQIAYRSCPFQLRKKKQLVFVRNGVTIKSIIISTNAFGICTHITDRSTYKYLTLRATESSILSKNCNSYFVQPRLTSATCSFEFAVVSSAKFGVWSLESGGEKRTKAIRCCASQPSSDGRFYG